MRVAVDLDGPCYEWDKTARYMLREFRGCQGLEEPSSEWFWHSQGWHNVTEDDWDWLWSEGVKLGLFRYGHMTKDTRVGLQTLVDMGHEIVIITNRPEEAVDDTKEWVEFFYKDIPHELHIMHGEGADKSEIDARVLIDDRPENITQWAEAERMALFWVAPWNRGARFTTVNTSRIYQVSGWKGVVGWFEHAASATYIPERYYHRDSFDPTTVAKPIIRLR